MIIKFRLCCGEDDENGRIDGVTKFWNEPIRLQTTIQKHKIPIAMAGLLSFSTFIDFSASHFASFSLYVFFSAFLETCFQKGSLIIHYVRSVGRSAGWNHLITFETDYLESSGFLH